MKILIPIIRYKGGHGRVALAVKKELEKRKHKVEILSREDDLNKFSTFRGFFSIWAEVSMREYDILYISDWSMTLPLLFKRNRFVCFHGHDPSKVGKYLQNFVGWIIGKRLIVVGDSLKQRFPKATLNYNGIDQEEFFDKHEERKYLGWVKRDYELIDEKGINKLAKKYNLPVSIAEDIPPEKMNDWYNSLQVFVSYPFEHTGFNMVWIEARAVGVPLVLGNNYGVGIKNTNNPERFNWQVHVNKLLEIFKR